ncbi:MAG: beta-phosphoglucomutase [Crocinitomicaceae bacterium]|jgi:beta-phosphoglucomutase|nr:beta-phosphoglucomutase [Crocinitomicaceae bacterium]MDP4761662.1 beta-phosphoglucomutase [Crocinitomicaceae bacterium]
MDKIKGLIFDLDGVIVTTEHNHFIAWQRTANALGIDFQEEHNELLKGVSRADSLKKILDLGSKSISSEEFEALLKSKNDFYVDSIQELNQSDLLPGVLDLLLKAKSKGVQLGIGSSSKNAKFILTLLKIDHLFDVVIDGNGVTDPKPHPEVFLNGANALGLKPSECIVFEDAASGITAAKAGGFHAFAVGNPHIAEMAEKYFNDLTEFSLEAYA